MIGLTDRQITILRVIVEEYIETAEPVGSESLERKYNLGVSPATVRNEMAVLTQQGLLKQPHTSAGRVPTPLAMKYYINELMQERRISVADEVATKERIWDYRHNVDRMLQEATKALAHQAGVISLACTTQGNSSISTSPGQS
jgi:heat-inducible transcriptional repressor